MNAYRKIKFYTRGQLLVAWAGIFGLYAGILAAIIIFI